VLDNLLAYLKPPYIENMLFNYLVLDTEVVSCMNILAPSRIKIGILSVNFISVIT